MNIYQKLNEVQKIVRTVLKTAKIDITQYRSYTAVTHDEVAGILHLPMANAGIFVEVDMTNCKIEQIETDSTYNNVTTKKISYMATVQMEMKFVNSDDPTDFFLVKQTAYAFDSGDKAIGKAQSMAVKYAYLKNLNLESMDDEEHRPEIKVDKKEEIKKPTPKPVASVLPVDYELKEEIIKGIKNAMSELTICLNMAQKGDYMRSMLEINSFPDLNGKNLNELKATLSDLNSHLKDKRAIPAVKKPSFVINN